MFGGKAWRVVATLAWRDLRGSRMKAVLIVAALALSIAAVYGVRGAERVAQRALETDLRRWLGADVAASTGESLDGEVFAAVDRMLPREASWTWITWTLGMSRSAQSPDSVLTVVKVVDAAAYPLYPGIVLEPAQPLADALAGDSIVVSPELLEKLHVRIGDTVEVSGYPFRIAALLRAEADRLTGFAPVAARTILSRESYERSGLAAASGASKHTVLVRLPAGADLGPVRSALQRILPEAGVSDYRESNQHAVSMVRVNIQLLGVTAFLVMVVGVAGIVAGMRQHVRAQTPLIAALKIAGVGTWQIAAVFLLQLAGLLAAAIVLGVPLGIAVRDMALWLAGRRISLHGTDGFGWSWEILVVVAIAILPVLPQPLAVIRQVSPMAVLRGNDGLAVRRRSRWQSGIALGAGSVFIGAMGARLVSTWYSAAVLVAGLLVSFGAAVLLVRAAFAGMRFVAGLTRDCALRYGLRNASNPEHGSHTLAVALSMGMMLMIATFEVNRAVGNAIADALPFDGANLLVGGFEPEHRDAVRDFLENLPGAVGAPYVVTQARLRLASVDGVPIEIVQRKSRPNAIPESWRDIGCVADGKAGSPREVTVSEDVARLLGARVGSKLEFAGRDRTIAGRVKEIRKISRVEKFWYTFLLDCSELEPASLHHLAAAKVPEGQLAEARRAVAVRFPMLAVLTAEDVSAVTTQLAGDILGLTRMVAWYAIVAGLVVMGATVTATRRARLREFATLSALGARPGLVARMHSVELLAIGVVAAAIGGLLSCGFLSVALSVTFDRVELAVGWRGVIAAVLFSAFLTVAAGWIPIYRLLRRRPLDSLREE